MRSRNRCGGRIREGAAGRRARRNPFRTETATLGVPSVNLDRALRIAGELEDDDLVRKIRSGK